MTYVTIYGKQYPLKDGVLEIDSSLLVEDILVLARGWHPRARGEPETNQGNSRTENGSA